MIVPYYVFPRARNIMLEAYAKEIKKSHKEEKDMSIIDTLEERESRYGEFSGNANIAQELKHVARRTPNWHKLNDVQTEALEMILHKIARILNKDSNVEYEDNWVDIAGYATLVQEHMKDTFYE